MKQKRCLIISLFLFNFIYSSWGQQEYAVKNFGSTISSSVSYGMAIDDTGNVYLGSLSSYDTINTKNIKYGKDTLSTKTGFYFGVITKTDSLHNTIWNKVVSCSKGADVREMAIDTSGNILVTGHFGPDTLYVDSSKVFSSSTLGSMYIMKLTPSGKVLWLKAHTISSDANPLLGWIKRNEIAIHPKTNGFYVATISKGPHSFGSLSVTSASGYELCVLLYYNSAGVLQWAKNVNTATSTRYTTPNGLETLSNGDVVFACSFSAKFQVGSIQYGNTGVGTALMKYDDLGNRKWIRFFYKTTNNWSINRFSELVTNNKKNQFTVLLNFYDSVKVDTTMFISDTNRYSSVLMRFDTAGKVIKTKLINRLRSNGFEVASLAMNKKGDVAFSTAVSWIPNLGSIYKFDSIKIDYSNFAFNHVIAVLDSNWKYKYIVPVLDDGRHTQIFLSESSDVIFNFNSNKLHIGGYKKSYFVYQTYIGRIADCGSSQKTTISTSDSAICSGVKVTLKASNVNSASTFQWLSSNLNVPFANDSSLNTFQAGNYSLVSTLWGCKDTSNTIKVSTFSKPNVVFPKVRDICSNDSVLVLNKATPIGGIYKGNGIVNDSIFKPTTTGQYGVTYVYSDTNGCKDSITQILNVKGANLIFTSIPSKCLNAKSVVLNQAYPAGGTYFGNGISSSMFSPAIAGVGNQSIGYSYQSGTCYDTAYQSIRVDSLPKVTFTSVAPLCESTFSVTLNQGQPAGGAYLSPYAITNKFYPIISKDGIFQVGYTYTDANGCSDTANQSIQVDPADTIKFASLGAICTNSSLDTLRNGIPLGGYFTINGIQDSVIKPSSLGAGAHNIKYHVSNSCTIDSATKALVINSKPIVNLPNFPNYCAAVDSFNFSGATPNGGSYYINNKTVIGFSPKTQGKGSYSIKYKYTDGNSCQDSMSQNLIVNAQPIVTFSSIPNLCNSVSSYTLNQGSPSGGVYSGTGVSGFVFNPNSAGAGSHLVTYVYSDSNSCSDSSSENITVLSSPIVSHPTVIPMCSNGSVVQLQGGLPVGGKYVGIGIDSSGFFTPSAAGAGIHKLFYIYESFCGKDSALVNVQVYKKPTVSFNALSSVCANGDFVNLTGVSPVGGTFSGSSVYGTKFNPIIGAGSYPIMYSFTDSNSCTDSATQTLVVDTIPVVSLANFSNTCENSGSIVLNQGTPSGGVYSGVGVTGSNFNSTTSGSYSILYKFTDSKGCSDSTNKNLQVDTVPIVSFTAPANRCESSAFVVLNTGAPVGGNYTGSGVNQNRFYPDSAKAGKRTITYSFTDGNSCTGTAMDSLTIYSQPNVSFTALSSVCANADSVPLTGVSPKGGTFGGISVYGTKFNPQIGAGSYSISYTYADTNSCTDSATQILVVDTVPLVSLNNLPNACTNSGSITLNQGKPIGGIYSGQRVTGNTFIRSSVGSYIIKYKFTNTKGCSDSTSATIQVDTVPILSFTAPRNRCEATASVVLNTGIPSGGTYSGTGVYLSRFYPDSVKAGMSTITYSYTDGNNCTNSAVDSLTVYAQPNVTLNALSSVCANSDSILLTGASPSGGTFSGTSVYGFKFNPKIGSGSYAIKYSFTDTNSCNDTATQILVVDSVPLVTLNSFSNVCANSSAVALNQGSPLGGTYKGSGVSGSTFTPSTIGASSIQYKYTNAKGCSDSTSKNIQVDTVPIVSFTAPSNRCEASAAIALSTGLPAGGTYSGTGVYLSNFYPDSAKAGLRTITYSYTDGNSCTNSIIDSITVYAQPNVTFNALSSTCANSDSISLTGASPSGGIFSGTSVYGMQFNPGIGAGIYLISYSFTDTNSCTDSANQSLVVDSVPVVTLSSFGNVCANSGAVTLSQGKPTGGTYSGTGVLGSVFTPSSKGSYAIQYKFTNRNGCSDSTSGNLLVDTVPNVTFSLKSRVCKNEKAFALNGQPSGGIFFGAGVNGLDYNAKLTSNSMDTVLYAFVDGNNCSDTMSQIIRIDTIPLVSFTSLDGMCDNTNNKVMIGGSPVGGKYLSQFVDTSNSEFSPKASGAGKYNVSYMFTDGNNCSDSANSVQEVWQSPQFDLGNDTSICDNQIIDLTTNIDSAKHLWSTGKTTKQITVGGNGTYWVLVTDSNNCLNSDTIVVNYEAICVGLDEMATNSFQIKYFPNPSNGVVNIKVSGFPYSNAQLVVRNSLGQVLKIVDIENADLDFQSSINLLTFENGMYFLELSSEDVKVVKRVMLNR